MIDGLDRDDAVLIDEYETVAAVWTQLRIKYYNTDKLTARINMSAIQNFEYTEESTIDSPWTKPKEYRRKVIALNRFYAAAYPDNVLFYVLTSAFYKANRYAGEKESQTREAELVKDTSLSARRQKVFDRRNSGNESDVEMEDLTMKCYSCSSKEYFVADCEYQAASNEYARKIRLKKEDSRRTKQNSKLKKSRGTSSLKKKYPTKRPRKSHAAFDSTTSSDEVDTSESDFNNTDDEIVALSKEDISKSPPNIWALDTGLVHL
ncbi:hypothetical protein K3495_g9785 [Podosphaera aphanis]|nr:hypothetical protein K3495_g9785 [Podosphaera aphanis]